jgi:hypothetical protein
MKKTMKRKLILSRETVRGLDPWEPAKVAGGATFRCNTSASCPIACGPTEVASCTSCVCTTDAATCA